MGFEIEAKLKVESHDAIRTKLAEKRSRCLSCVVESNHLFDREDSSLRDSGCGLRVRRCAAIFGSEPAATITFKGPRLDSELKLREEIDVTVDEADKAIAILEAIGFKPVLCFDKRRETWLLDDCRIELDEVPYLGRFVEIEGPNEQRIRQVLGELDLDTGNIIQDSYVALLADYCEQRGLSTSRITFKQAGET